MIFKKKKITNAYTVEHCNSCKKEVKRKFIDGDCLFVEASKCSSCNGTMFVEKIFGETIEL